MLTLAVLLMQALLLPVLLLLRVPVPLPVALPVQLPVCVPLRLALSQREEVGLLLPLPARPPPLGVPLPPLALKLALPLASALAVGAALTLPPALLSVGCAVTLTESVKVVERPWEKTLPVAVAVRAGELVPLLPSWGVPVAGWALQDRVLLELGLARLCVPLALLLRTAVRRALQLEDRLLALEGLLEGE